MYLDKNEVENLRKVYNKEHPPGDAIPEGDIDSVWKEIKLKFHKNCETGSSECIIASMLSKPNAPESWVSNPEEWLSSDDIDALEDQFEKVFSSYHFLGTFPIDFDKRSETGSCLVSTLCSLDIKKMYDSGKTQIGLIFNTDVSTGPGKHWVAIFCDLGEKFDYPRITYFDSYSQKPEKEIQTLMRRWKQQWDSLKIHSKPMVLSYNKTRHQYQDSECGMYCLYFHLSCLLQLPMEKRIPDNVIRGFRGMLFRVGKK